MRFLALALLLLCAQARAATLSSLEVLRGIAAEQGVVLQELPAPPKARATPASQDYQGTVRVVKKSPEWRRPKEALKDRSLILDNAKPAWIKDSPLGRSLPAGARAWIKGRFAPKDRNKWPLSERLLDISEVIALPAAEAKQLPAKNQNESFSVTLAQVDAWCDHMPTFGKTGPRQYLVVAATLSNKTDKPLTIAIARVFLSFGADSEGTPVPGLSLRGQDGRPSGETTITLAPNTTRKVELRGDGLFPENAHDKTLYVTLSLSSNNKTLFVRGSGDVLLTQ